MFSKKKSMLSFLWAPESVNFKYSIFYLIFFLTRHPLGAFLTFWFSKLHIMSDQLYHIGLDSPLLPKLDFPRSTMLQPIQRLKITDCSFLVWCNCLVQVCQKANTETKHRHECLSFFLSVSLRF